MLRSLFDSENLIPVWNGSYSMPRRPGARGGDRCKTRRRPRVDIPRHSFGFVRPRLQDRGGHRSPGSLFLDLFAGRLEWRARPLEGDRGLGRHSPRKPSRGEAADRHARAPGTGLGTGNVRPGHVNRSPTVFAKGYGSLDASASMYSWPLTSTNRHPPFNCVGNPLTRSSGLEKAFRIVRDLPRRKILRRLVASPLGLALGVVRGTTTSAGSNGTARVPGSCSRRNSGIKSTRHSKRVRTRSMSGRSHYPTN